MMGRNTRHDRIADAKQASKCAEARLWGMKYRAERNPPKAATGGFPYPARTCAEWGSEAREAERIKCAKFGAAMVTKALARMAA